MRLVALLLSALLFALPCLGSLPAHCPPGPAGVAAPASCCAPQGHACGVIPTNGYCCPTQTAPAPATDEASLPPPSPAPELVLFHLPAPIPALHLTIAPPAPPSGLPRPALYLLHRSFRS